MKRDFAVWFDTFLPSINDFKYYCDFEKVYKNVDEIKVELNILNSLIGSKAIEKDFIELATKYPRVCEVIPILLAVREKELYAGENDNVKLYKFHNSLLNIEDCIVFMRETGLFDLIQNHIISNLYDYATGIEVGLDSNARKNRGGHKMEDLVESYIKSCGFKKGINYFKEFYISDIQKNWKIDLSKISNSGKTEKRFDFVVKTNDCCYLIETNFYSSSGSKLNETARSYKEIALSLKGKDIVGFVWFTDGSGWKNARHNLEETFDALDDLYNLNDIKKGVMKEIFI